MENMVLFNSQVDECSISDVLWLLTDGACYVYGTINMWDGSHELYATKKSSILEAVEYAIAGGDDFEIVLNEGELHIESYHHDGTNVFTIGLLTSKGENKFDNNIHVLSNDIKKYMVKKIKVIKW